MHIMLIGVNNLIGADEYLLDQVRGATASLTGRQPIALEALSLLTIAIAMGSDEETMHTHNQDRK